MSKAVLICFKDPSFNHFTPKDIETLSNRLMPDNIKVISPLIISDKGILIGVFNPNDSLLKKENSICLGNIINPRKDWWIPHSEMPNGSFALFRVNENEVELVSDAVASRTIWYTKNKDFFIASTSQRAIVHFLKDFSPNLEVFSWMLSSGTIGPNLSWDKRIKRLSGDSQLILNRKSWELQINTQFIKFTPINLPPNEFKERIRNAFEYTFNNLEFDDSKWYLTLSGGYDSRIILLLLKDRYNLKCITWGLNSSINEKHNDAYIAKELANYYNLEHTYFNTNISAEPIEKIFRRFIIAGEGRVDHIEGYMDGFKIMKTIYENGIFGILRGDEAFGWTPIKDAWEVRKTIGVVLLSDIDNLRNFEGNILKKQTISENFIQRDNESLEAWRDRLYHEFRIPNILAALNDLKLSYIEVINPLLSKRILEIVRTMPDSLRTNKSLYKEIVHSLSPNIPFAKYPAIEERARILRNPKVVELLSKELNTFMARKLLSDKFIDYLLENMSVRGKKKSLKDRIKPFIPKSIQRIIYKKFIATKIDFNILAFRAYLIYKMTQILNGDAMVLNR